jgi:hypothetical protein
MTVLCNCAGLNVWLTELSRSSNARLTSFYISFYIRNKKIYLTLFSQSVFHKWLFLQQIGIEINLTIMK